MADPLSSIPGVSSGVDWKALVEQMLVLERRPAVRLEATVDANTRRRTALEQLRQALDALRAAADALGRPATLDTFAVTAAGADAAGRAVLSATAGAGAAPGAHTVTVTALAAAQRVTAGRGAAAGDPLPATGTLTLARPDGTAAGTVPVGSGSTLASLRDAINALDTGAAPSGVRATLVGVSATDQRLVLTATRPGAANGFTLGDDGTGLLAALGLDPAGATPPTGVAAADAAFEVDGLPITRPTNVVGDVLSGVTLTLSALGTSAVSVARTTQGGADAARAFVEAYNKVVALAREQGAPGKPLQGEPLLRTLRAQLSRELLAPAPDGVAADLASLGAAGLALQKDGTLALDAARFERAAGERPADLAALLGARLDGFEALVQGLASPITGGVDRRARGLEEQSARLRDRVDAIDARLEKRRAALLAQYSKFEAALGRLTALQGTMSAQFAGLNRGGDR